MSGLFGGKSKTPPAPKPTRMPTETDPEVMAAAQRTKAEALRRQGRLSTILTDQTGEISGSTGSGEKLGA